MIEWSLNISKTYYELDFNMFLCLVHPSNLHLKESIIMKKHPLKYERKKKNSINLETGNAHGDDTAPPVERNFSTCYSLEANLNLVSSIWLN